MPDSAQKIQRPDAAMAEIIGRFEQLYAASTPEEPAGIAAPPDPGPTPLFADNEFELPSPSSAAHEQQRIEPVLAEPQARIEPHVGPTDLDEAFAILRSAEPKRSSTAARDLEDKEDVPPRAPRKRRAVRTTSPRSLRRYAVPALAATLFVGLATGYVVTRHGEAPTSATASAAPAAPLKMDYSLQQPAKRDSFAEQRTATTPAAPAR